MKHLVPTVFDLVRQAVEVCDPDEHDPVLGRFAALFRDDDEPATAIEDLEPRLAAGVERVGHEMVGYEIDNPALSMVIAVALYLAERRPDARPNRRPDAVLRLAALAQWNGRTPENVSLWLALHIVAAANRERAPVL
jgi:hypothetical protein